MPMFTSQRELFERAAPQKPFQDSVTIGTVVDTNDPQQMGRVRVICQQWGDSWSAVVEDMPWAIYVSPFGGQTQVGTRGPGVQESEGGLAYGMWAIPKVGAQVVVMCIDGNPTTRAYFGCVYDQFTPHTLPHGRFTFEDHPELEKDGASPAPFGPYTSAEHYIQPLTSNMKQAFGNKDEPNYEYRSRAADYTASRVDVSQLQQTYSKVQDDEDVEFDGWTSTQGYQASRSDPDAPSSYTSKNYDSMVYSITSPGFHAMSMDDRQENCRLRLRTTSGHQIIMDDTNERIYIATAQGNNWIELDQAGNVDIYTASKLSVHAAKEINFTSDDTIRMYAKKGIHMHSDDEIRLNAAKDIHVKTAQSIRATAAQDTYMQAGQSFHVTSGSNLYLTASSSAHVHAASNLNLQGGSSVSVKASSSLKLSSTSFNNSFNETHVSCNKPGDCSPASASSATQATLPSEQPALWTNRVPDHEPFARVMTKDDFTHEPELPYTDKKVGRWERGRAIIRGMFWRR